MTLSDIQGRVEHAFNLLYAIDLHEAVNVVPDRLLTDLGYAKLFGTKNPFPWMEMLGLEGKTNFFERRVSEYAKAGVKSATPQSLTWDGEF